MHSVSTSAKFCSFVKNYEEELGPILDYVYCCFHFFLHNIYYWTKVLSGPQNIEYFLFCSEYKNKSGFIGKNNSRHI